jgi:hypothetical protein
LAQVVGVQPHVPATPPPPQVVVPAHPPSPQHGPPAAPQPHSPATPPPPHVSGALHAPAQNPAPAAQDSHGPQAAASQHTLSVQKPEAHWPPWAQAAPRSLSPTHRPSPVQKAASTQSASTAQVVAQRSPSQR